MPKHVMSVGFEIPGDAAESVDYWSDDSLLDADIVVFSPNLEEYDVDKTYQGKSVLTPADSGRLLADAAHWEKELQTALQAGRTVFVMMLGVISVYVYAGQTRSAYQVNIFEPYSSIPVSGLAGVLHISAGARIKTTRDIGVLAPYWQEFGEVTYYQAYLEKGIGTPALITQTGDKMVGGIIRTKDYKGTIILLPTPNLSYMVKERSKQKGAKVSTGPDADEGEESDVDPEAERSVGDQFVNALVEIDRVLNARAERTPAPMWANDEVYTLKEEVRFRARVDELERNIAGLEKQKLEAEGGLDAAGNLRGLVFETGKPLESAILEGLRVLEFAAEGFVDSESEFDAVFTDTSGRRLLGEAEGRNDKAINIDKLDQLERNIQEDFKKREDTEYAKGVLFGNAFRLSPPAERGEYFTAKCLAGAKRLGVALVRTPDLFTVAKFLKENPDSGFAASCRKAILETTGNVVEFPPLPAKT
ncbi:MAG: hypothetical protein ACLQBK_01105 [Candidatus Sulfotelmatobacter sp.]